MSTDFGTVEIDPDKARQWMDQKGRCGDERHHKQGDFPPMRFVCALHDFHQGPHVTWMMVADEDDYESWAIVTWPRHPDD